MAPPRLENGPQCVLPYYFFVFALRFEHANNRRLLLTGSRRRALFSSPPQGSKHPFVAQVSRQTKYSYLSQCLVPLREDSTDLCWCRSAYPECQSLSILFS